jgi:serine O-acetyltransferase
MGTVIGETTEIGNHVTLFQQVTLGGTGKERGKRHPTLRDHVVVAAGAKVLGNIEIGEHSKVGANAVVIQNVPPHSTVVGVPGRVVTLRGLRMEGHELDHNLLPDPILRRLQHLERDLARHAGSYAPRQKKKK